MFFFSLGSFLYIFNKLNVYKEYLLMVKKKSYRKLPSEK